jgi:MYXO-CTERM domain-containing protein
MTGGDAGVDADTGADAATTDAATLHDHDAASEPEPHTDDAGTDEPRAKKDSGGCHIASPGAHAPSVGWLALSLLSLLSLRRRKR